MNSGRSATNASVASGPTASSATILGLVVPAFLAVTLVWKDELATWDMRDVSLYSLVSSAIAYAFVVRRAERGFWSVSAIFLLVAMCFHQGLLLYSAFDIPIPLQGSAGSWFGSSYTKVAIVVVTVGLLSYALAAGLWSRPKISTHRDDAPDPRAETFALVGFAILAFSVASWFAIGVLSLGLAFPLSSYHEWLAATANRPVTFVYYGIGLGLALVVASPSRRWRRSALVVFVAFGAAALPMGLRGEVLFSTAAAAAVYARSGVTPRRAVAVLLVVGALTGINAIQQVRQVGLGNVSIADISATPFQGIAELGASLRTVDVVVSWHDLGGDPSLRGGATYWAPFDRAIRGQVLGLPTLEAGSDLRLMNVEMRTRETTIGGSFIAEAYRNFGPWGALIVPAIIGALLGWFDRRQSSLVMDACIGVVLVALLQHVRNSFTPVPFQLTLGLTAVIVLGVMTNSGRPPRMLMR